jgi:hypothetical protein
MGKENEHRKCPEGQVLRDGKCTMPEVTFTALIMSLNTSALFHLGEIGDPTSGEKKKDLVLAKHTIDTLSLLEKKTVGNVTEEEKELLGNIIFDLRMRYIKAVQPAS